MPLRPSPVRSRTPIAAGLILVSVALLVVSRSLSPIPAIVLGGLVAGVWIAVVAYESRRRRSRIGDVEFGARRLLTTPDEPASTKSIVPIKVTGDDYSGLESTLGQVQIHMNHQLKEVAKKTRNLEALIGAMDEPLIATDSAERVILCNPSAEAIFDVEPGNLLGTSVHDLFTHEDLIQMHDAARAGQTRRGRIQLPTPLGTRIFQISASPVPVAWGEGIFGAMMVLRDVTELDQAVQVKTDFVANASHELRTPVAAIRGAVETLRGSARDDDEMTDKLLGMIVNHTNRLEEMLRDLLDLSRLESPDAPVEITRIDFLQIQQSLRAQFEHICTERNLGLQFEVEPTIRHIQTDRKLLFVMLRNFIENATKFARDNTVIRVVGAVLEEEIPSTRHEDEATPAEHATGGVVRFEVCDEGVGIPIHQQERVFERFFQVDPARTGTSSARRGTGLGLAIVKHAAKALDGHVGLESVWGKGTTAWFEIPVGFWRHDEHPGPAEPGTTQPEPNQHPAEHPDARAPR